MANGNGSIFGQSILPVLRLAIGSIGKENNLATYGAILAPEFRKDYMGLSSDTCGIIISSIAFGSFTDTRSLATVVPILGSSVDSPAGTGNGKETQKMHRATVKQSADTLRAFTGNLRRSLVETLAPINGAWLDNETNRQFNIVKASLPKGTPKSDLDKVKSGIRQGEVVKMQRNPEDADILPNVGSLALCVAILYRFVSDYQDKDVQETLDVFGVPGRSWTNAILSGIKLTELDPARYANYSDVGEKIADESTKTK